MTIFQQVVTIGLCAVGTMFTPFFAICGLFRQKAHAEIYRISRKGAARGRFRYACGVLFEKC